MKSHALHCNLRLLNPYTLNFSYCGVPQVWLFEFHYHLFVGSCCINHPPILAAMVEQISTHRRSTTAAALRRGQIKISEPVPLENSGPSPIWKPSSSHRQMRHPSGQHPNQPFPSDNITGLQGTPSSTSISTGTDPLPAAPDYPSGPMGESSMPMSAEAASHAEAYNNRSIQPQNVAAADGSSLHRKRSSYFVKDAKEGTGHRPDSVSGGVSFQPRPSITDSVRDIPMDTPTKKKRRSGSIRGAFRRMFSKREKQTVNPEDPQRMRGPRHEYHTSVSSTMIPIIVLLNILRNPRSFLLPEVVSREFMRKAATVQRSTHKGKPTMKPSSVQEHLLTLVYLSQ